MTWEKRDDLIDRYRKAGLTARELANATGLSPSGVTRRLCGFIVLQPEEERQIVRAIEEAEAERAQREAETCTAAQSTVYKSCRLAS